MVEKREKKKEAKSFWIHRAKGILMLITTAIVAFTLGLVLEPAIAKLVRRLKQDFHNRKVGKARRLLESEGFTISTSAFICGSVLEPEDAWL